MSLLQTARPILNALLSTALAVLAFAAFAAFGAGVQASLIAALILAGLLNIGALASLNGEAVLPTCSLPVGD
jgi:hypothetical protein